MARVPAFSQSMSGEVSLPPPFDPFLSLRCGKTPPHWGSCLLSQRCPQTGPGHHSTWCLGTGDQPLTQATAEDQVGQVWSANFLPCAPAQVAAWPCPSELFCRWPRAMLAGAGARGRGGGGAHAGPAPLLPQPAPVFLFIFLKPEPQLPSSAVSMSVLLGPRRPSPLASPWPHRPEVSC